MGGIDAEHFDLPRVALAEPLEDLDRRRLPRSVRPEEGEDLAVADLQVHPCHRLDVAEGAPQPADSYRHVHGSQATAAGGAAHRLGR